MTLLETYGKYLVKSCPAEMEPEELDLTADGWRKLAADALAEPVARTLGLRYLGGFTWADEYEDGRRRVMSFFKINDAFATFQWGWNFDFVPRRISHGKTIWARTDKSIHAHIFELSPEFYRMGKEYGREQRAARQRTIVSRYGVDAKDPARGLEEKQRRHQSVFCYLLPLMKEYYAATASYEGTVQRIGEDMEHPYYRMMNGDSLIVRAFIEQRMGDRTQARRDFDAIPFAGAEIRAAYEKHFIRLEEAAQGAG